jgi:8-oxo-dGTP pyrophosphatase MutT (NUDIX family)
VSAADLPGEQWSPGDPLADAPERWPVRHTTRPYQGFIAVREDSVTGPDGAEFTRVVMESPGAVGVLVVDDAHADEPRVLLLRQYRHAAGSRLLEVPAGLLDMEGEEPLAAAVRELEEEASLRADSWSPLLRIWSSPGLSDEHWDVYLASGLSVVPEVERAPREHEEADMTAVWVPLSAAVEAVLEGRIADSMAVSAVLALHARRTRGDGGAV